jgi:Domain of unknown function (DUF5666)/Domain of unknown function (DUF4382)
MGSTRLNRESNLTFRLLGTTSVCAVMLALSGLLVGCGGSYGAANAAAPPAMTNPPANVGAPVTIGITDAPADRVLSFELKIASVTLLQSDGTSVPLINAPREVEVTHLSGTTEAFAKLTIPPGTYTSANIVVAAAEVIFLDANNKQVKKEFSNLNATVSVPLSPALVVANAPLVLILDANVASSVSIDPQAGTVTVNPSFTLKPTALPPAGQENEEDPDDGQLEHIVGQVTNVSGSSFTIMQGQSGMSLTFSTDANTHLDDFSSLASLTVGAVVRVEAHTLQDGSLLATEVELLSGDEQGEDHGDGENLQGLISAITGSPVTSFMLLVHDGSGKQMNTGMMGSSATVSVSSNTDFRVDDGGLDLSGLTVPAFSAATLSIAQEVEIDNDSSNAAGGTVAARRIKLEQQALMGTVSNSSGNQFTLTVADDSAFAMLTGMKTVTVVTSSKTDRGNNVSTSDSSLVKVRGLLFFDPAQKNYTIVAKRLRNDN